MKGRAHTVIYCTIQHVQWSISFATLYLHDLKTIQFGGKVQICVQPNLYFKTTCNIRPHCHGPMGGHKIQGGLRRTAKYKLFAVYAAGCFHRYFISGRRIPTMYTTLGCLSHLARSGLTYMHPGNIEKRHMHSGPFISQPLILRPIEYTTTFITLFSQLVWICILYIFTFILKPPEI